MLDSAVKHGIIDKRGAWYTMGDEKIGQGKENAVKFIEQNPELASEIEKKVRAEVFPGQVIKSKGEQKNAEKAKKTVKKEDEKTGSETVTESEQDAVQNGLF